MTERPSPERPGLEHAGPERAAGVEPTDGEALRRRLYRPGATESDVLAYAGSAPPSATRRGAEGAGPDDAPPEDRGQATTVPDGTGTGTAGPEAPAPAPAPARRRPRRLLLGAALAVPALLLVALLVRPAAPSPAPRPTSTPSASDPSGVEADGAAVSTEERAGFIRRLVEDRQAGLSAWLDRHAGDLPAALAQATRSDTLEFAGDGTREVRLDPPSIGDDGGRVTVLLVLSADAQASWRLARPRTDDASQLTASGAASGEQAAGLMTAGTVSYPPGQRPVRLRVTAPPGVRWGVATVFSN